MEILDQLGPLGTSKHSGSLGDVKDAQVRAFQRIQSNLTSIKFNYGETYSNFIIGATIDALIIQLQWTPPSHA